MQSLHAQHVALAEAIELCSDCGHGTDGHDRRAEDGACEECRPIDPCGIGLERGEGCQHPRITDADLAAREAQILRDWGGDSLLCRDCNDYLYPSYDRLYVGEPQGAGRE